MDYLQHLLISVNGCIGLALAISPHSSNELSSTGLNKPCVPVVLSPGINDSDRAVNVCCWMVKDFKTQIL